MIRKLAALFSVLLIVGCGDGAGNDGDGGADGTNDAANNATNNGGTDEDDVNDASQEEALGPILRPEVEMAAGWSAANAEAPDSATVAALKEVPIGSRLDIFLGLWSEDSQREVERFWAVLDMADGVPFTVNHFSVDQTFSAPDIPDRGIDTVPTWVVVQGQEEVGRIVGPAPNGIEADLLSLLDGSVTGTIEASP